MVDRTGQTFGLLTVIAFAHVGHTQHAFWRCRCECGNETVVRSNNLTSNNTLSCGCLRRDGKRGGAGVYLRASIRDRLRALAKAAGKSMSGYMAALVEAVGVDGDDGAPPLGSAA